jgi:hypothetical protein
VAWLAAIAAAAATVNLLNLLPTVVLSLLRPTAMILATR